MEERRTEQRTINTNIESIIGMLRDHITNEEFGVKELHKKVEKLIEEVKETRVRVDKSFGDLEAHTHVYHHGWTQEKINGEQSTGKWWSDIKKGVLQAAIIVVGTAIIGFIIHATWKDVKTEVKKEDVAFTIKEEKNV